MTTTTAPATRRFGKCTIDRCKLRLVVDIAAEGVTEERKLGQKVGVPVFSAEMAADTFPGVVLAGIAYCAEHEWAVQWQGVKATTNDVACGAKCSEAATPLCKCSCGGENHGSQAI